MLKGDARAKKEAYFAKLKHLLTTSKSIFLVHCDNVGSYQMQQIRMSLREEATILMGKNTMVRKAVRDIVEDHPQFERLLHVIKGNVGFVFTSDDLKTVRDKITGNRVRAPAKAGAVAPIDVFVPAGGTGMEPGKTSFFQALGIPTKITKGMIEIVSQVHLIKAGNKVGPSEATLLNMMNISPFTYGLVVDAVYDSGTVFKPEVLDVEEETLIQNLLTGIQRIAALSMALNYPTLASVPHSLINGYKNVLAIALATDYSFPAADKIKDLLSDPTKLAALQAAASAAAPAAAAAAAPVAEEKEEAKEESDEDMGFGLFD